MKNKKNKPNKALQFFSIGLPNDVKNFVAQKSSAENVGNSTKLRQLIYSGLRTEYGVEVTDNKIVH